MFTTPSCQTFTLLAWGWAVSSGERQTITAYLWLTGAPTVKHFSRFYAFLGGALYQARWHQPFDLGRYRPWYRHKQAPSQLDIVWACREALQGAGVFLRPRFAPTLAKIPQGPENTLLLAA